MTEHDFDEEDEKKNNYKQIDLTDLRGSAADLSIQSDVSNSEHHQHTHTRKKKMLGQDVVVAVTHVNFKDLLKNYVSVTNMEENISVVLGAPVDVTFTQQLWYGGHSIGEVTGVLKLYYLPFLSQMKIGYLDNTGINFMTQKKLFRNELTDLALSEKQQKVTEFIKLKEKIMASDTRKLQISKDEIKTAFEKIN